MESIADTREIRAPTVRRCERCGRIEQWNSSQSAWICRRPDENRLPETRHCIHEWDVTGSFCPIVSTGTESEAGPEHEE